MGRAVHYRLEGVGTPTLSQPTACTEMGFNVPDTDLVSCRRCQNTELFALAALRHREVVEALAYPKEDHPCLTPHRRR